MGMSETPDMTTSRADDGDDLDFEAALKRLEQIVQTLERGDAPLEKSIDLYEQGQRMRDLCARKLEAARVRVEKIRLDAAGKPGGTEPLDPA
jgi:exodeoxyribonuclease VII small subunit